MVEVEERKEMGLHKEGWVRVMDVFGKTCIIKTYLGNGDGND